MAIATIRSGVRMRWSWIITLTCGINAIVAGLTLQYRGIDNRVVKSTAKIKGCSSMAYDAIDCSGIRMSGCLTYCGGAIVAADTIIKDIAVINKGRLESYRRMAIAAISSSLYMISILSNGYRTIVATLALSLNAGMIKGSVGPQFQKSDCIMADTAFFRRRYVIVRFTDR